MKSTKPFQQRVEELFAAIGNIRVQTMFGGTGIYCGEDMFALADDQNVYIKADDDLKASLEEKGGAPFVWTNPSTGTTMKMSYVSVPVNALENENEMSELGRQALDVAMRARRAKVKSPRRHPF
ncbi:MAG: TfoX/Sxy family protein [Pseudomonadota bacterium]